MIVDLDQRVRCSCVAVYAAVSSNFQDPRSMEIVYFTLTAIACYVVSDLVLKRMELIAGRRFENRTVIFFAIMLALALVSFALVRNLAGTS
ncbi:MAG: hypothetical protein GWP69_07975 [Gammaproteobacteria bacterium]|nr:hypothetical protein [Gammaproteobacteria bacterium]